MTGRVMTGHVIEIRSRTTDRDPTGWGRIRFACRDCELTGHVRAVPAGTADAFVADLMAVHWGATGGEE